MLSASLPKRPSPTSKVVGRAQLSEPCTPSAARRLPPGSFVLPRFAAFTTPAMHLDNHFAEIVAVDPAFYHRYREPTSMPGIGLVLACTLIALLPELAGKSRRRSALPTMTSTEGTPVPVHRTSQLAARRTAASSSGLDGLIAVPLPSSNPPGVASVGAILSRQ
jgi:hypothetical protein